MTPLRQRMIDDMTLHGLKPKTIKAYVPCVARFARHFGKSPTLLGTPEIRAYCFTSLKKSMYPLAPTISTSVP